MRRASPAAAVVSLLLLATASAQEPDAAPVLTLTADTALDPAVSYGGLVIAADGITVDGRGARVVGPVQRAAEAAGTPAAPNSFTGIGVRAQGRSSVTLRNLRVQGFELGLLVEGGDAWRLEDCDLSDNFHDPDFGWGEQGEKGGLLLRGVSASSLQRVRANRCWNACSLVGCGSLEVQECDFSHSSNTCLKLWTVTDSVFTGNDLSWGLRIAPGEVHARDSTCVLIESGSNGNRFERNDATHGGDGFFIRVLNNWTSRRNVFVANDASYANNNGFEAWSPENTYEANVANHCSYGFWLGASDKTVLRGNEAGWNGDPAGFHNAPESFGHGGIVFVNGPSHHTLVDGNWLHDNAGGGLVLRGDEPSGGRAWRAWHWVIQRNRFENNRWGVWMKHASFLDFGPNTFAGNREGDIHDAGDVDGVRHHDGPAASSSPPALDVRDQRRAWDIETCTSDDGRVSVEARSDGDSPSDGVSCFWDMGDGTRLQGPAVDEHRYARPGFHRIACTASDGELSSLAWLDAYVFDVPPADTPPVADLLPVGRAWPELPATAATAGWAVEPAGANRATFTLDGGPAGLGQSIHAQVAPYSGERVAMLWPATRDAGLPAGATTLTFWIRTRNPNLPAWQGSNPIITLHEGADRWLRLTPARDWLGNPPDVHFRDEWMPLDVPLAGGEGWTREVGTGGAPGTVNWISLAVDSWGAPPLDVWIDAMTLR
jgi:parallel beta-helix repeat protein